MLIEIKSKVVGMSVVGRNFHTNPSLHQQDIITS